VVDLAVARPPVSDPVKPAEDIGKREEKQYRVGLTPSDDRRYDEQAYGDIRHLEGRPIYRYTVTWQPITQQMSFQRYGFDQETLFFEARLGRDLPLPSWVTFDAHTQTVTAIPDDTVKPGTYTVRVVARDAEGNEAESVLTIHVLRDVKKSFDAGAAKVPHPEKAAKPAERDKEGGQKTPDEAPAPEKKDAPAEGGQSGEIRLPAHGTAEQPIPRISPAVPDSRAEGGANISLSRMLLALAPAGRMIQAARFIESLAAEEHGDR
jgi:hypothetical protein